MTDPFTRASPIYRTAVTTDQARGRPALTVYPRPRSPVWAYCKVTLAGVLLATACVGMWIAWL